MKKSTKISLTVVAAMGMAACNRRPDPCEAATYNDQACREAIQQGGYYYHGAWVPMMYSRPYPYYYDSYSRYVGRGGTVHAAPSEAYSRSSGGSHGSVGRGGFGSTGGGHAFGGHGGS